MKAKVISFALVLIVIMSAGISFKNGKGKWQSVNNIQDTVKKYKDGFYEGKSRASYTDEPFWGIARITFKDGEISEIRFLIRDSSLHETFNDKYAKHFADIPEYIEQTKNDWNGVQTYSRMFSEKKDPNKVDVISGATWSYNIFKASVTEALKNVKYK